MRKSWPLKPVELVKKRRVLVPLATHLRLGLRWSAPTATTGPLVENSRGLHTASCRRIWMAAGETRKRMYLNNGGIVLKSNSSGRILVASAPELLSPLWAPPC